MPAGRPWRGSTADAASGLVYVSRGEKRGSHSAYQQERRRLPSLLPTARREGCPVTWIPSFDKEKEHGTLRAAMQTLSHQHTGRQRPREGSMSVLVRKCLTPNGPEGKEAGQWLRDLSELM